MTPRYAVAKGDLNPYFLAAQPAPYAWTWKFEEAEVWGDATAALLASIVAGADLRLVCDLCEGCGKLAVPSILTGKPLPVVCPSCHGQHVSPRTPVPQEN